MTHPPGSRRAGILVPLFSIPSTTSWGIGEIGDLEPLARWLERSGQRLLQLLPINEMPPGERSPYSALSAMAIDPQFISMRTLEDFDAIGGEASLTPAARGALEAARIATAIDYATVRSLKFDALRRSFAHFRETEWTGGTHRASAFRAFCEHQAWWLEDYALFRALHARFGERSWLEWPQPMRDRHPNALAAAREELADDILFRQYLQWVAGDQWGHARDRAGEVALFGDLPFMVSGDSADVWARQDEFRLDVSVGVPPDAFSETGQDWGLPAYRWDVFDARGFDWLQHRARRNADLFDGYRVDHLVGFFRTYSRKAGEQTGAFDPSDEASQIALGESLLRVFQEDGAQITAEDLGSIPDFVRASLRQMGVPGYKVLRWERAWKQEGKPFLDPATFPPTSVVTTSVHDIEPIALWWEVAEQEERHRFAALLNPSDTADRAVAAAPFTPTLRDEILGLTYHAGSELLLLPVQDAFGWPDRINTPATIGDENWTWRMPIGVDAMQKDAGAIECADRLRRLAEESERL